MIQQEDILYGRISIAGEVIHSGGGVPYTGEYTIKPKITQQSMATQDKTMTQDVTILSIPYYEVSNIKGLTAIIGDSQ